DTRWGILGGETHAMWRVEYILNAIVVAAERGDFVARHS
ncbi:unnamed protein product, partial [marine sediment metagenome]